jgi:hypothetical protein
MILISSFPIFYFQIPLCLCIQPDTPFMAILLYSRQRMHTSRRLWQDAKPQEQMVHFLLAHYKRKILWFK